IDQLGLGLGFVHGCLLMLQAAGDRIDQFGIPASLPFGFEPVIYRLDNLRIPALLWSQKIVLY
ncbi:MAG: hypothetical protein ACK53L_00235, partial [Pirellulaceae bacterium]